MLGSAGLKTGTVPVHRTLTAESEAAVKDTNVKVKLLSAEKSATK